MLNRDLARAPNRCSAHIRKPVLARQWMAMDFNWNGFGRGCVLSVACVHKFNICDGAKTSTIWRKKPNRFSHLHTIYIYFLLATATQVIIIINRTHFFQHLCDSNSPVPFTFHPNSVQWMQCAPGKKIMLFVDVETSKAVFVASYWNERQNRNKQKVFSVSLFRVIHLLPTFGMFVAMQSWRKIKIIIYEEPVRRHPTYEHRITRGSCQRLKMTLALAYRKETKWIRDCEQTTSKHHRLHRFHFIFMITDRHTMDASMATAAAAAVAAGMKQHTYATTFTVITSSASAHHIGRVGYNQTKTIWYGWYVCV